MNIYLPVGSDGFIKHDVNLSPSSRGRCRQHSDVLTLPVAVEPVKEILATSGSVQRTSPTDGVFSLEQGTTLKTPGGIPARSASCQTGHQEKVKREMKSCHSQKLLF